MYHGSYFIFDLGKFQHLLSGRDGWFKSWCRASWYYPLQGKFNFFKNIYIYIFLGFNFSFCFFDDSGLGTNSWFSCKFSRFSFWFCTNRCELNGFRFNWISGRVWGRESHQPYGFITTVFLWITAEQGVKSSNPRCPIQRRAAGAPSTNIPSTLLKGRMREGEIRADASCCTNRGIWLPHQRWPPSQHLRRGLKKKKANGRKFWYERREGDDKLSYNF